MIQLDVTLYGCILTKVQYLVYPLRLAPGRPMLGMYGILSKLIGNYDECGQAYMTWLSSH